MQKTLLLAALSLLLFLAGAAAAQAPAPGTPGLGDSLYPTFGNGGYDVEHYTLNMGVDPDAGTLSATLTIEAKATAALSAFNLDFIGFELTSAQVNGQDAAYTRSGQELTLTPAVALSQGEQFTASIAYQGTPTELTSVALPVLTGWVAYDGGSFVLSEPDGAANFYPVNDHPLDKATYSLRVTVPPPYRPAMNGVVTDVIENADGSTTTLSEVRQPMASYLTTINIAEFDLVQTPGANGVPLRNYFEQSLPVAYRAIFARQDEMMGYFQDVFGPYPFDVYGAVVVNTATGSALESQTLSIFGLDSLDLNDIAGSELTVAHELAHQWFGDSVSVADWRDIWLNEGWATYSEGLWLEHAEGPEALAAWADDLYAYATDEGLGAPAEPTGDNLFDDAVYVRGGLALHALRLMVGDAAFFEIAQAWASRYRDGNASTDDFVALVREIGGEDAGDALLPWLYAADMPALP